ncbi:hypothetical protein ACUN9Y_03720 [Halomonas sp. V046]|uniref:hypothetical protein n=1 Tax=Halomonas sp. V046 TaxID=3459611 RepID=UPI0040440DAD
MPHPRSLLPLARLLTLTWAVAALVAMPAHGATLDCNGQALQPGQCYFSHGIVHYPDRVSGGALEGTVVGSADVHTRFECRASNDSRRQVLIGLDTSTSYDAATGNARSKYPGLQMEIPATSSTIGGHLHQTFLARRFGASAGACLSGELDHSIDIVRHGSIAAGTQTFGYNPNPVFVSAPGATSAAYFPTHSSLNVEYIEVVMPSCGMVTSNIGLPDIDLGKMPSAGDVAGATVADLVVFCANATAFTYRLDVEHGVYVVKEIGLLANAAGGATAAAGIGVQVEQKVPGQSQFSPLRFGHLYTEASPESVTRIPLRASYFRLSSQASGGQVAAAMVVTLNYY